MIADWRASEVERTDQRTERPARVCWRFAAEEADVRCSDPKLCDMRAYSAASASRATVRTGDTRRKDTAASRRKESGDRPLIRSMTLSYCLPREAD